MAGPVEMNSLPLPVKRYLDKKGATGPWALAGAEGSYAGAVVIPSIDEGESLFQTLNSLSLNSQDSIKRFLIVVVVNHGENADQATRMQNKADLARLQSFAEETDLSLAWVDAANDGLEIPAKQAGVGFARKLGLDLALCRLDWSASPLLVCLDADTLVENNYLQTIEQHFATSAAGAAVLPFKHQVAQNVEQQQAIDRYELFLRSYVFGLHLAGSPYAFNTVGSAMACRALAYVRCGGMNTRRAGEDFYFLQKLAKTDGVAPLSGTVVYPEPRVSGRVPFGTGRSMERLLSGDRRSVLFYPVETFKTLAEWLSLVAGDCASDAVTLLSAAREISPILSHYLEQSNWLKHWPVMQQTYQEEAQRLQAFHIWFDGFKSLRLVHLLCAAQYERGEPEDLLPAYFAWQGQRAPDGMVAALTLLRIRDGL